MVSRALMLLVLALGVLALGVVAEEDFDMADFEEDDDEFHTTDNDEVSFPGGYRAMTSGVQPNVCNGGSAALVPTGEPAPCTFGKASTNIVHGPKGADAAKCSLQYNSTAPGFTKLALRMSNLEKGDVLEFTTAFGEKIDVGSLEKNKVLVLPSTFGSLNYNSPGQASRKKKAFRVSINSMSNNCQRVIEAPAGSGGRLIFPGFDKKKMYNAGTMCQWWIRAPKDKKIVLKFNSFDVGADVEGCKDQDYIGVDKSGDPAYKRSPLKLCGTEIPFDVMSEANMINVVANGRRGDKGFCLNYKVIDG